MSPEEKKLDKLKKLLEVANEDFATPDDLIALSEGLLGVINRQISEKEKSLKYLISELGRAYSDDNATTSAKFSNEVKRLERKIPNRTDLTEIYEAIDSCKAGINNFPTELTINNEAVRDGLELLPDGEKLDINAIQDLQKILDELATKHSGNSNIVAGVRLLSYLADVNVNGITDGQGIGSVIISNKNVWEKIISH